MISFIIGALAQIILTAVFGAYLVVMLVMFLIKSLTGKKD